MNVWHKDDQLFESIAEWHQNAQTVVIDGGFDDGE